MIAIFVIAAGVVRTMYFETSKEYTGPRPKSGYGTFAAGLSIAAVIALGLAPSPLLGMASRALEQVVLGP